MAELVIAKMREQAPTRAASPEQKSASPFDEYLAATLGVDAHELRAAQTSAGSFVALDFIWHYRTHRGRAFGGTTTFCARDGDKLLAFFEKKYMIASINDPTFHNHRAWDEKQILAYRSKALTNPRGAKIEIIYDDTNLGVKLTQHIGYIPCLSLSEADLDKDINRRFSIVDIAQKFDKIAAQFSPIAKLTMFIDVLYDLNTRLI